MAKQNKNKKPMQQPASTAARTRSQIQKKREQIELIKKQTMKLKQCTVRLLKLTEEQILVMLGDNLANIEVKKNEQYNLRQRPAKPIERKEVKTKHSSRTATSLISPSDLTASSLWRFVKKDVPELAPNALCLAKMNSYSPWPAILLRVMGKRSEVYFFGDGKKGTVNTSEIVPNERCAVLIKKYLHIRNYSRAVREMELTQNIPSTMSIINR